MIFVLKFILKKFLIFILLILSTNCSNHNDEMMVLNLQVEGFKKGKIYLQKINDSVLVNVDSIYVKDDSYLQFKQKINSPEIFYIALNISKNDNRIEFFAENSDINIKSNLKKFNSDYTVTGSFNDSIYRDYQNIIKKFNYEKLDLIEKSINLTKMQKFDSVNLIENEIQNINKRKLLYSLNYAVNNGNSSVAPYIAINNFKNNDQLILDTIFMSLDKNVKESKYGEMLSKLINSKSKS